MCNRYQLRSSSQQVRQTFGVTVELFEPEYPSEYYPGRTVPVISPGDDGGRTLAPAAWGIPLGKHRVTNARDDKLGSTWKRFTTRRVVFPLDAAIEYHYRLDLLGQPTGKPTPYAITRADGELSAIAGFASQPLGEGPVDADDPAAAVTMLTCPGNDLYADVHNKNPDDPRMLVYLVEPEDVSAWLDPDRPFDELRDLVRPAPAGWLTAAPLR